MIFKKGGQLRRNLSFKYGNHELEIVSKYAYLGIVFTTGGSFNTAQTKATYDMQLRDLNNLQT